MGEGTPGARTRPEERFFFLAGKLPFQRQVSGLHGTPKLRPWKTLRKEALDLTKMGSRPALLRSDTEDRRTAQTYAENMLTLRRFHDSLVSLTQ